MSWEKTIKFAVALAIAGSVFWLALKAGVVLESPTITVVISFLLVSGLAFLGNKVGWQAESPIAPKKSLLTGLGFCAIGLAWLWTAKNPGMEYFTYAMGGGFLGLGSSHLWDAVRFYRMSDQS